MRGRGFVVRRGRSVPVPVRRSGPGLARLADGGKGGVYIQLSGDYTARIKPLRRGWRAVPASCLAEFGAPVFNRRFNPPGNSSPASPLAPVLVLVLVLAVSGFGPAVQAIGAGRLRRAAGPVLRLAPLPVRRGPVPVPVLPPCRSGAVRFGPPVPVQLLRGPGLRSGAVLRSCCRSSPARPFPKATAIFPPPTPGRKFPAIFPARYFMRAV